MTIKDYIVAYNETFRYVEEKFESSALRELFAEISRAYCVHLDDCVKRNGIDGCMEYWGGADNDGTLGREKAACEIKMQDGIFTIKMNECPSIGELRARGQEPYVGKTTYCDHCRALYEPVLNRYGLTFEVDVSYRENGGCAGECFTVVQKIKDR